MSQTSLNKFKISLLNFLSSPISKNAIRSLLCFGDKPSNYGDNNNVFLEARILITDWSGAGMEFSLSKEKPSFFIDTKQRIRNSSIKHGDKILEETFEHFSRDKIGIVINNENIDNIDEIIKDFEPDPNASTLPPKKGGGRQKHVGGQPSNKRQGTAGVGNRSKHKRRR